MAAPAGLPASGAARNIPRDGTGRRRMAAAAAPVGFIGLGMMGLPMARSLLRHGRALLACDPNPAAREALAQEAEAGAVRFAAAPADVAEGAETIILVLPDSKVVAHVVEGPSGLLPALRP